MTAALDAAQTRLSRAQHALHEVLSAGGNTAEARARVEAAQSDVDRLTEAEQAAADQQAAKIAAGIHEQAADGVRDAVQQIASRLAQLAAVPVPQIDLPQGVLAAVLNARQLAAQAAEAASEAQGKVARLQARQRELERRRAEIIARRQAGGGSDAADGAALALIEADGSGLAELLEQATAEAAGPARQAAEAAAAVGHAEALWAQAIQAATAQALAAVCRGLEDALVSVASELYQHRFSGGVTAWQPRQPLKHLVGFGSPLHRVAA